MIRLSLRCRREDAEIALAELLELAPSGVEEVDYGEYVELAVYGPPGEVPTLPELKAAVGGKLIQVKTAEIADDWHERWREFHRPVDVAGRIYVRPPWEAESAEPREIDLLIDPGRAFGTGAHATTHLCLELMLDLDPRGELLDLGCGSGVLAIAGSKLGFDPVAGNDFDPLAVEASKANAQANGVDASFGIYDLRGEPAPVAATVVANLMRPLLLEVAANWVGSVDLPRQLILSGLLTREAGVISSTFESIGFTELRRSERGDWGALLLVRL